MRKPLCLRVALGLCALYAASAGAEGYYTTFEGGGRFMERATAREIGSGALAPNARYEAAPDDNAMVGLTVGKHLPQNMRAEVEIQWSSTGLGELKVTDDGGLGARFNTGSLAGQSFTTRGDVESLAVLFNAFYEVDYGLFRPYFGGGAGFADVNMDHTRITGFAGQSLPTPVALADDHSTVLAWQAGAGLALPLTARWTVTVDYRYFATEDPEIDLAGRAGRFKSSYASHNVVGGLRFEF